MIHTRPWLRNSLAGGVLALVFMLAACSAPGTASTGTPTPVGTPSATSVPTPAGDYAFIHNGDLWVRTGTANGHPATFLHLATSIATWGPIAWSPDHSRIAFALRAPPFAPGLAVGAASQGTGTIFIVNLNNGTITGLHGSSGGVTIPLVGNHIVWQSATTLLYTVAGVLQQAQIDTTGSISVTPITGPKSVWEIAIRKGMLYYSTVTNVTADGQGSAELHRVTLTNTTTASDQTLATLGTVTLPTTLCGFICPADPSTPYVPYAWAVSADGTQIAYQAAGSAPIAPLPTATVPPTSPTPTPPTTPTSGTPPAATPTATTAAVTATATVTPAATPTKATTGTPAPAGTPVTPAPLPSATPSPIASGSHFVLAQADGTQPQPIFTGITSPTTRASLAFAPDGKHLALASADPGPLLYVPSVQALGVSGVPAMVTLPISTDGTHDGEWGIVTWTPNSQGFSLTVGPIPPISTSNVVYTYLLDGHSSLTERSADGFAWATN